MTVYIAFVMSTSSVKYGLAVTVEVGHEIRRLGATRVMVVTNHNRARTAPVPGRLDALGDEGVDSVLFDGVHIEPTDWCFKDAIRFATGGRLDGCVAVHGGSSYDVGFGGGWAGGMLRGEVEEKGVK